MPKPKKTRTIIKNSVHGKFASKEDVKRDPDHTYVQRVRLPERSPEPDESPREGGA